MPGEPLVDPVPGPGAPPPWESVVELWENVPLDPSGHHTFDWFATTEIQLQFFRDNFKTAYRSDNSSYFFKNGSVVLNVNADSIKYANYGRFRNPNYDEPYIGNEIRGYYFFITNVFRVGPHSCRVTYEIDVLQTFMFHYTLKPCFIERETVYFDQIGRHTLEEGLDLGPLVVNETYSYTITDWSICAAFYIDKAGEQTRGRLTDGVYTGLALTHYPATDAGVTNFNNWVELMSQEGQVQNIVSVFMLPTMAVNGGSAQLSVQVADPTLEGYTPLNAKLYSYPYNRFVLSNMRNEQEVFKPELFGGQQSSEWLTPKFAIKANFNLNATMKCYPRNYMRNPEYWDAAVTLDSFPMCPWTGNVFANWYARNQNTIKMNYMQNALGIAADTAARQAGAALDQGAAYDPTPDHGMLGFQAPSGPKEPRPTVPVLETLLPTLARYKIPGVAEAQMFLAGMQDKQNFPYALHGAPSEGTAAIKWGRFGFEVKRWTPRIGYAERIDNFFQMYGYKVNRLGVPAHNNREKWDYVKTIGCQLVGRFPAEYQLRIRQLFDQGITFWHNYEDMYAYNQKNTPKGGGGVVG